MLDSANTSSRYSHGIPPKAGGPGGIGALLIVMLAVYAVADIATSAGSGLRNANRIAVHITMLGMGVVIVAGIHQQATRRPAHLSFRLAPFALLLPSLWIVISDLMAEADVSLTLNRIWLAFWWFLVFSMARAAAWNTKGTAWITGPILLMLALYSVGIAWGAVQIRSSYQVVDVVSGFSYFVTGMFPIIRAIPQPRLRMLASVAAGLVVVASLKRGAIIVLLVMLLIELLTSRERRSRLAGPFLVAVVVAFVVARNEALIEALGRRLSRDALSDGSGRSGLYSFLLEEFQEGSLWEQLVGTGSGSIEYFGVSAAHNDWLEMLISYGVVGLAVYAGWMGALIGIAAKARRLGGRSATAAAMAAVQLVLVSLYSVGIFGHASLMPIAILGAVAGMQDEREVDG